MPSSRAILLLLTLTPSAINSQTEDGQIHYSLQKREIHIIDQQLGYTAKVEQRGEFTSNSSHVEYIPYSELEEISNIEPRYYNSRNKLKRLKDYYTQNSAMITSSFYGGYRAWMIDYSDAGQRFELSYDLKGEELMTFSSLPLSTIDHVDSLIYTIYVPNRYHLAIRFPNERKDIKFDSTSNENETVYVITISPVPRIKKDEETDPRHEVPESSDTYARTVVVPAAYKDRPWDHFNEWNLNNLRKQNSLREETLMGFDDRYIRNIREPDSIPVAIFDFVKTRIAYVDIENGMGAYQPRDPNDILAKRQGDCKDMAFLLYQLLKRYGHDAYMAVSSTIDHPFDLDFPSISSADHMICVLRKNDHWIFLDATESVCPFGSPSIQIQGRNVFVLDSVHGQLVKVPPIPSDENTVVRKLILTKKGGVISGKYYSDYKGISARRLQLARSILKQSDMNEVLKQNYAGLLPGFQTDSIKAWNDGVMIRTVLNVSNGNSFVANGTRTYITLKFLPNPHSFPAKIDPGKKILVGQTTKNSLKCVITVDSRVKKINCTPVRFEKNGFLFEFNASLIDPTTIEINYLFSSDRIVLGSAEAEAYHEVNELITKTLNTAISYE